ncbi:MAG: hypothetical protein KF821_01765 [Anaerolineales bacterium]|jgi:hypothetical protein|nr:hypothetical protein [Anaerolineales bacterium]
MDYDREASKFMKSLTNFHDSDNAKRRLANLLRKAAASSKPLLPPFPPTDEPLPSGDDELVPA